MIVLVLMRWILATVGTADGSRLVSVVPTVRCGIACIIASMPSTVVDTSSFMPKARGTCVQVLRHQLRDVRLAGRRRSKTDEDTEDAFAALARRKHATVEARCGLDGIGLTDQPA
jgi:hypothetical protein